VRTHPLDSACDIHVSTSPRTQPRLHQARGYLDHERVVKGREDVNEPSPFPLGPSRHIGSRRTAPGQACVEQKDRRRSHAVAVQREF
jgi:hypothetical protein